MVSSKRDYNRIAEKETKKRNLKPTELKPYEFIGIGLKDLSRVQLQNKIAELKIKYKKSN